MYAAPIRGQPGTPLASKHRSSQTQCHIPAPVVPGQGLCHSPRRELAFSPPHPAANTLPLATLPARDQSLSKQCVVFFFNAVSVNHPPKQAAWVAEMQQPLIPVEKQAAGSQGARGRAHLPAPTSASPPVPPLSFPTSAANHGTDVSRCHCTSLDDLQVPAAPTREGEG